MNSAQAHSKQSQIVQNFFSKAVQVIAEARLSPDDVKSDESASSSASSQSNINKWFNLELKELDFLHDKLRPWRQILIDDPPPPLVVETYLNPSKLRPGQTIVLGDARCSTNQEIVLERWVIEFKPPSPNEALPTEDLPAVYKRAIVSIRSLYTSVRLLPSYQLHQRLCRQKLISVPLKLGIRIHNGATPISSRGRIGLSKSIADQRSKLQQFRLKPINMPIGSLSCGVTYRTEVNFNVEDIEKVMAQKFLELDAPYGGGSSGGITGSPNTSSTNNLNAGGFPSNSYGGSTSFQPGSQQSGVVSRPILNFTRPFKSPEGGSGNPSSLPRSTPSSVNSGAQIAPQSISGSASSVMSTNSRFSSSFASHRAQATPRSLSHEIRPRTGSMTSQGSHESGQVNSSLDPGSGMYMTQSDVGEFVKFVDDTRRKGSERIKSQQSTDVDSMLSRYQNMRPSYSQLSDSIIQGSVHQDVTVKPERRRNSGPRNRLGFYQEDYDDDDDDEGGDSDLLFALSDMNI